MASVSNPTVLDPKKDVPKRKLAVLTSGGDAAGMSACVRAVVRMGLNRGCETYIIREGWEGLIRGNAEESTQDVKPSGWDHASDQPMHPTQFSTHRSAHRFIPVQSQNEGQLLRDGQSERLEGKYILRVGWEDVRGFLGAGGTLIGTARSMEFKEFAGRTKAAHNLVKYGIDALVVCGGDGSLTGADRLRAEWPDHLKALVDQKKITPEHAEKHKHLNICGVPVGSIDNDMAGTDLTIGAATALHRICDAVDSISSTASSHSRAFVVEVMGRHCGWLAVMAGLSTGADYIFIPESPPPKDWQADLRASISRHRKMGKRKSIVIVAEGALDEELNPISANDVKGVLAGDGLKLDTRVTTLGHTQRGGQPCAYDRLLATIQGVEAVEALLESKPGDPSPVIGLAENKVTRMPLMDAVKLTQSVATAIESKDFAKALSLRDSEFAECLSAFRATTALDDSLMVPESQRLRIGIIHIGAPAGGMNAATRTAVQYCHARGHTPVGIFNGFPGLLEDYVDELSLMRVDEWTTRGGSELGTNRVTPSFDLQGVSDKINEHRLNGLLVIGGFEAFVAIKELAEARSNFPAFRMPLLHLPATISNNVPLSEWSLGSDTSINVVVENADAIKLSAAASRNRVFVIETQGGTCGYIATLGALASGATMCYIPEEGMTLNGLAADIDFLKQRYGTDAKGRSEGRLVILSEKASKVYKTDVLTSILSDEGGKLFDARDVRLGHTLQGNVPTPRDRTRAARLAVRSIQFIERHGAGLRSSQGPLRSRSNSRTDGTMGSDAATIIISGAQVRFASTKELAQHADMQKRRGKDEWWMALKDLVTLMSGRLNPALTAKIEDEFQPVDATKDAKVNKELPL